MPIEQVYWSWLKCNRTQGNGMPSNSNLRLKAFPYLRLLQCIGKST